MSWLDTEARAAFFVYRKNSVPVPEFEEAIKRVGGDLRWSDVETSTLYRVFGPRPAATLPNYYLNEEAFRKRLKRLPEVEKVASSIDNLL